MLGNHDQPRIASRVGAAQARVAAMLLLTLRGTPTIYYGDEIGMRDVPIPPERVQDPFGRRTCPASASAATRSARRCSGTPAAERRLHDAASPGCRFAADYATCNVENQRRDPGSILTLYRR